MGGVILTILDSFEPDSSKIKLDQFRRLGSGVYAVVELEVVFERVRLVRILVLYNSCLDNCGICSRPSDIVDGGRLSLERGLINTFCRR